MDSETIVRRMRRFLLLLAAALCVGTPIELLLIEHTEDPIQFIPFLLCGLGLIATVLVLIRPQRATLLGLRLVMALLLIGSGIGVYEHVTNNLAFELEIRPGATVGAVWFEALRGASPLMAPGILALAAVLALAATYYHPALEGQGDPLDPVTR